MAKAVNLPVFNHYNRDMAAVILHVLASKSPLPLFVHGIQHMELSEIQHGYFVRRAKYRNALILNDRL